MFETFEHTADLGLRVRAADLPTLFAEAGMGLFSIVAGDLAQIRLTQTAAIRLEGDRRDELFFDWLSELLYQFETKRLLLGRFDVRLHEQGLEAVVAGEPWDPQRHRLEHEVKAITYHGLKVEQTPDGWLAEVVVDI